MSPNLKVEIEVPLSVATPAAPDPLPFFVAGSSVPCRLRFRAPGGSEPTRFLLQLQYRCHGSCTPEIHPVLRLEGSLPALPPDGSHDWTAELALPASGPLSYSGDHVKIDWTLVVGLEGRTLAERTLYVKPPRAPAFPAAAE